MEKINIESFSGQTLFLQSMRIRRLLPQFHAPHSTFRKGRYDPDGFLVFASNDNCIPN